MAQLRGSTVILALEEGVGEREARRVVDAFGVGSDSSPACRWHAPDLVTLHLPAPAPDPVVTDVAAAEAVRSARVLRSGEFLHDLGAGAAVWSRLSVRLRNGAVFERGGHTVIAGPCSVESRSQVMGIAMEVREAGAQALRGGVFKPRTSPYSFGGLGRQGLELLCEASEASGLPVVTEALQPADLDPIATHADMIQIGSRNMHNFPFLFQAGRHPTGTPILLKRGFAATLKDLVLAAEYVLLGRVAAGHTEPGLILCERGLRTFDTGTRFTMDVAAFPALAERTHLPVIADPSHPAGVRSLVTPLAMAACSAGAAGLLVEVSLRPDEAWCDGEQSLTPAGFRELMRSVRRSRTS